MSGHSQYSRALVGRCLEEDNMSMVVPFYLTFKNVHRHRDHAPMDSIGLDKAMIVPVVINRLRLKITKLDHRKSTAKKSKVQKWRRHIHDLLQMLSDTVDQQECAGLLCSDTLSGSGSGSGSGSDSGGGGVATDEHRSATRISDAFRSFLRETFSLFASREDGRMSMDDFSRYVISCGAGTRAASEQRTRRVFVQFEGDSNATTLGFEGFCAFYENAAADRPKHVWDDILSQQYTTDLKPATHHYEEGTIQDVITRHEGYGPMVDHLLEIMGQQKNAQSRVFPVFGQITDATICSAQTARFDGASGGYFGDGTIGIIGRSERSHSVREDGVRCADTARSVSRRGMATAFRRKGRIGRIAENAADFGSAKTSGPELPISGGVHCCHFEQHLLCREWRRAGPTRPLPASHTLDDREEAGKRRSAVYSLSAGNECAEKYVAPRHRP